MSVWLPVPGVPPPSPWRHSAVVWPLRVVPTRSARAVQRTEVRGSIHGTALPMSALGASAFDQSHQVDPSPESAPSGRPAGTRSSELRSGKPACAHHRQYRTTATSSSMLASSIAARWSSRRDANILAAGDLLRTCDSGLDSLGDEGEVLRSWIVPVRRRLVRQHHHRNTKGMRALTRQ